MGRTGLPGFVRGIGWDETTQGEMEEKMIHGTRPPNLNPVEKHGDSARKM